MPGRLFITSTPAQIAATFGAETSAATGPEPRLDVAPGETLIAVVGGPRRLVEMRWGMIPMGRKNARGRPVMDTIINARSETLFAKSAFEGVRRAIVPANGWYEWTGERRRKTRWALDDPQAPLLAFAAIWDLWRGPGGVEVASVATVTVPPNEDVAPIHHRMGALLAPEDWPVWLGEAAGDPSARLRPWPRGRLRIRESDLA